MSRLRLWPGCLVDSLQDLGAEITPRWGSSGWITSRGTTWLAVGKAESWDRWGSVPDGISEPSAWQRETKLLGLYTNSLVKRGP